MQDLTRQLHKLNKNLQLDTTTTTTMPEYDSSGSSNFSDNGLLSTSATPNHTTRSNTETELTMRNDHVKNPMKKISFGDELDHRPIRMTVDDREGGVGDSSLSNQILVQNDIGVQNKKYRMQDHEVMCDDVSDGDS